MDLLSKKYKQILRPLQYVVITSGYLLMAVMTWLLVQTTYSYVKSPYLAQAIKIPPLLPLFPYFPQIFKLESLFPPFYFTYFLVALAIVALSHEFAHGLFARLNNIRIKSTGLAFFGPFFGAFVEQDDKDMNKAKKVPQLAVLAAGTFANVIMTIIFGLVMWGFFAAVFAPAGVNFNSYSTTTINVSSIDEVNGIPINSISEVAGLVNESLTEIEANGKTYFVPGNSLKTISSNQVLMMTVYEDSPALRERLPNTILEINGQTTSDIEALRTQIISHRPGEKVSITVLENDQRVDKTIVLGEKDGAAYLGVGFIKQSNRGIGGFIRTVIYEVKDPFTHYEPKVGGDFAWFIYNMLWWIVMINILVALFNMLPLGMLDGGRFFLLTVWGLTGSENAGKKAFSIATWIILGLLALMMAKWLFVFIS